MSLCATGVNAILTSPYGNDVSNFRKCKAAYFLLPLTSKMEGLILFFLLTSVIESKIVPNFPMEYHQYEKGAGALKSFC